MTGKKPSGAMAVNGTAARKIGGKQRQQLFVFTVQLVSPSFSYTVRMQSLSTLMHQ